MWRCHKLYWQAAVLFLAQASHKGLQLDLRLTGVLLPLLLLQAALDGLC